MDILDACKIADFVLFVLSPVTEVDSFGEQSLRAIKAQGVPSVVSCVQRLDKVPQKKHHDIIKSLEKYIVFHFPDACDKVFPVHDPQGRGNMVRYLSQHVPRKLAWRDRHSFISPVGMDFEKTSEELGTLKVVGWIRGQSLSANRLVHIPNYGDFQISLVSFPIWFFVSV